MAAVVGARECRRLLPALPGSHSHEASSRWGLWESSFSICFSCSVIENGLMPVSTIWVHFAFLLLLLYFLHHIYRQFSVLKFYPQKCLRKFLLSGLDIHFLDSIQRMQKICQENSNQKEADAEKWALGNKKLLGVKRVSIQ